MSYCTLEEVKSKLRNFLNFEGDASRYEERQGYTVSDEDLQFYIDSAESQVLKTLGTLYLTPLENKNGSTDLDDFEPLTKDNLKLLFISFSIILVVSYSFAQVGDSIGLRTYGESIKEIYDRNIELALAKDVSGGIVFPAYPDLKLSKLYYTREENIVPFVVGLEDAKESQTRELAYL